MSRDYPSLIVETINAEHILTSSQYFYNALSGITTVQRALEELDKKVVYANENRGGLLTSEDKILIDWLRTNASGKIFFYSYQEEAEINPTTKIRVADNEGLTFSRLQPDTVRIGLKPFYNSVSGSDGSRMEAKVDDKSIKFGATETADVVVKEGIVYVSAEKALKQAFLYSLIFGG
jgi:hypothetical protein